ncbi:5'/3'-nucleotidase SurE [Alicyclobacillaceae bacterium I2511]|jgi:5'-nucleotidase|nr:5'/3'-nucleotidase SurE [Alicyclobacillaceae bacterium I2511]
MRILISNDDGIHAPGIRALLKVVADLGEVVVVAPDGQRSASSHGISLHGQLQAQPVSLGYGHVTGFALTGTPVDCVKWAISVVNHGRPFDLMFSGINEGANLATDVLYSGTVAAAGEAALLHTPAIAFSLVGPPFPFTEAADTALRIIQQVSLETLPADTFLNVNIPAKQASTDKWTITKLGARSYKDEFVTQTNAHGQVVYRYSGEPLDGPMDEDTDVAAIMRREISMTPLRYRFTDYATVKAMTASEALLNR